MEEEVDNNNSEHQENVVEEGKALKDLPKAEENVADDHEEEHSEVSGAGNENEHIDEEECSEEFQNEYMEHDEPDDPAEHDEHDEPEEHDEPTERDEHDEHNEDEEELEDNEANHSEGNLVEEEEEEVNLDEEHVRYIIDYDGNAYPAYVLSDEVCDPLDFMNADDAAKIIAYVFTPDPPVRRFRAEDQMIPWSVAEERYYQDGPSGYTIPPPFMLQVHMRVLRVPHRAEKLIDLHRMGEFDKTDRTDSYRSFFIIDPDERIKQAICDTHTHLRINRRQLRVYFLSKGRVLDENWTMRQAIEEQANEGSLEEPDGKFVIDVQIFERFERPEEETIVDLKELEKGKILRKRRCKSLPYEIWPDRRRRLSPFRLLKDRDESEETESFEHFEEEPKEEIEENSLGTMEHPEEHEQQNREEPKEEMMMEFEEASDRHSTPIRPSRSSGSSDPELRGLIEEEDMPSLPKEDLTASTEPSCSNPNPIPDPNVIRLNRMEYQHMLREKERIRRRGPRAPKESSSTTYHELPMQQPAHPSPQHRAPVFRIEGPIPFDAKVNLVAAEFNKSLEEVRKLPSGEIDRLFNQIASSHIAKSQQLQQHQMIQAQNMQRMPRPPASSLPVRFGSLPAGHPGNRPNIRLPPGAPAGLINRLVPVMMPMSAAGPVPPQILQQWMAQQAAAMAAKQHKKEHSKEHQKEEKPSTSTSTVYNQEIKREVKEIQEQKPEPSVPMEETTDQGHQPEKREKSRRRKYETVSSDPCVFGDETTNRNHFVSVASPYYPPGEREKWMFYPTPRTGAINVPNTIRAITEFINLCEAQETDPSRFLELYYRAETFPRYRQSLNATEFNIHVSRRRCDIADVNIPRLDAQQQLELYLMRFQPDEEDDEKWKRFYALMEWPLPPDGRFPKGRKIDGHGHLSVHEKMPKRAKPREHEMCPEEKDILKRAIATAKADQLAEKLAMEKSCSKMAKRVKVRRRDRKASDAAAVVDSPKNVPDADFLQSLAPSIQQRESPGFGEEEHSQTSSDVTSEGIRPNSNGSSIAQEEMRAAPDVVGVPTVENSA